MWKSDTANTLNMLHEWICFVELCLAVRVCVCSMFNNMLFILVEWCMLTALCAPLSIMVFQSMYQSILEGSCFYTEYKLKLNVSP